MVVMVVGMKTKKKHQGFTHTRCLMKILKEFIVVFGLRIGVVVYLCSM